MEQKTSEQFVDEELDFFKFNLDPSEIYVISFLRGVDRSNMMKLSEEGFFDEDLLNMNFDY